MIAKEKFIPTKEKLSQNFKLLKELFGTENVSDERKHYIQSLVREFGFLPYSHQQALEELTDAETIIGIEEKLKCNNVYKDGVFIFNDLSPVVRAGLTDAEWIKREQHNIKLINIAGLGNANVSDKPGLFIDWLKQTLTLPSGNLEEGVLSTTAYFIPFHPRDFGCAYIPTESGVSKVFEDKNIAAKLQMDAKEQVQLYFALTQLCGHPTMYDVLPQSGRFSKTVLANPYAARWFDVKELVSNLLDSLNSIAAKFSDKYNNDDVAEIKELISKELQGDYSPVSENSKHIYNDFQSELNAYRKEFSNSMMKKENQEIICAKATKIINLKINKPLDAIITEDDIFCQGEIIGELAGNGLWSAPGGAWCSSGVALFDKMSEGAGYPIFKHFDHEGNDVTHSANLDCQTPYYFVHFEKGEYNSKVIDFYIDFLKKLQKDYNFDGFRVDHIDHIVDKYSENSDGFPISYRAPKFVLGKANEEIKKVCPHFVALAEYMLWDNFYKEYHQDMKFDLLWGNDIVAQFTKTPEVLVADNKFLADYNSSVSENSPKLSIIKTYNNQDGEFKAIDQYPAQLGEQGALFKLFKFKFMPGGKLAQRPVMFIDGDESFNKVGIEKAICFEGSMKRENNLEFFKKFNAINLFALNNKITLNGYTEILRKEDDGLIVWQVKTEKDNDSLYIIANQNSPLETLRGDNGEPYIKVSEPIYDKTAEIPFGYKIKSEILFSEEKAEFIESSELKNTENDKIFLSCLLPAEYKIYKLEKMN